MPKLPNPLNFIYKSDTARMMIVLNALSLITSHLGQINGLRKSNRENKEFLIKQERNELILDAVLTVIPPSLVKKGISQILTAKTQSQNPVISLNKNQIDGINTVVTIAYSVLASNIIMPILKNKITNKQYQHEHKIAGKALKNTDKNIQCETAGNTLNVFSNSDNTITATEIADKTVYNNLLTKQIDNNNLFNDMQTHNRSISQSAGLRI